MPMRRRRDRRDDRKDDNKGANPVAKTAVVATVGGVGAAAVVHRRNK